MMNLGGPATREDVYPFLKRLFSDHDIIPLPFQKYLGPLIAKRRTSKIQLQYDKIGGGSPIRMWTEKQALLMERKLDEICPDAGGLECQNIYIFCSKAKGERQPMFGDVG